MYMNSSSYMHVRKNACHAAGVVPVLTQVILSNSVFFVIFIGRQGQ